MRTRLRWVSLRLVFVGVAAATPILVSPASAFACTPIDPQGPDELDQCVQSFTTPFPTTNGQSVTDYAIEYIPAGSVNVSSSLQFSSTPSNATLSKNPFEPSASSSSENPDHTFPNPGPGEQAARQIWTWTANGASSPSSGMVTFTVAFEEPVIPMTTSVGITDLSGNPISQMAAGQAVHYNAGVHNPNDDPVTGHFLFDIHTASGQNFTPQSLHTTNELSACSWVNHGTWISAECSLSLPAGGTASLGANGAFPAAGGTWALPAAIGAQISDGQDASSVQYPEADAQVTQPQQACSAAAKPFFAAPSQLGLPMQFSCTPTGQQAAALKKCKTKHGQARTKCRKKAKRLPV